MVLGVPPYCLVLEYPVLDPGVLAHDPPAPDGFTPRCFTPDLTASLAPDSPEHRYSYPCHPALDYLCPEALAPNSPTPDSTTP